MTGEISILRARDSADHGKVGFIELFFDLVFVFAVTRLSHLLLEHLSLEGLAQTAFLMLAVWIVWMWTTWVANWLDARHASVRLMLLALMGAGLVMSSAIPRAFGEAAAVFVIAYVFMQHFKNGFLVWALKGGEENVRRNFMRIHVWLTVSAVFWIAGVFADGAMRWALWGVAVFLEFASPWWNFFVPGLGASTTKDWSVDPAHMAERCGLFVILALGESIILLGATFSNLAWDGIHCAAFLCGFAITAAFWWIYFATAAEKAEHAFEHHPDAGRIARAAYTYAHIPIVAGIILMAVSGELLLAHPGGHVETSTLWLLTGGPALFLLGNAIFSRLATGRWPRSHLAAIAAFGAQAWAGAGLTPLMNGLLVAVILAAVALWESLRHRNPPVAAIQD